MKLKDIDLRVWDNESKEYNQEREVLLSSNGSIYRIHTITGELEQLKDESLEVEFWTGLRDLNNAKIYEGDIVAHYAERGGIEYYSKVVFNQGKGAFEFVCIEHPIIEACDELANPDIGVVGNIHENKDL